MATTSTPMTTTSNAASTETNNGTEVNRNTTIWTSSTTKTEDIGLAVGFIVLIVTVIIALLLFVILGVFFLNRRRKMRNKSNVKQASTKMERADNSSPTATLLPNTNDANRLGEHDVAVDEEDYLMPTVQLPRTSQETTCTDSQEDYETVGEQTEQKASQDGSESERENKKCCTDEEEPKQSVYENLPDERLNPTAFDDIYENVPSQRGSQAIDADAEDYCNVSAVIPGFR